MQIRNMALLLWAIVATIAAGWLALSSEPVVAPGKPPAERVSPTRDAKGAIEAYERGIPLYEARVKGGGEPAGLARCLVHLAAAHLLNADAVKADAAFTAAQEAYPEIVETEAWREAEGITGSK